MLYFKNNNVSFFKVKNTDESFMTVIKSKKLYYKNRKQVSSIVKSTNDSIESDFLNVAFSQKTAERKSSKRTAFGIISKSMAFTPLGINTGSVPPFSNLIASKNKSSAVGVFKPKIYTSYSKLSEVKLLTIGLASPLRILQWAEKTLPNGKIYGEVLNANTLHHKTFKPQKGGLFCERIFGPLKDFECACGKVNKSAKQDGLLNKSLLTSNKLAESFINPSINEIGIVESTNNESFFPKNMHSVKQIRKFCPDCDVEYTWSVIRRYQLGYIKLISPVTHIWFLKGTPSYLSILLDIKKRHLQYITYCSETLTLENSISSFSNLNLKSKSFTLDSPSKIFNSWQNIMTKTIHSKLSNKQNYTVAKSEKDNIQNYKFSHFDKKTQKVPKTRIPKKAMSQKNWKTTQQIFLNQPLISNYSNQQNTTSAFGHSYTQVNKHEINKTALLFCSNQIRNTDVLIRKQSNLFGNSLNNTNSFASPFLHNKFERQATQKLIAGEPQQLVVPTAGTNSSWVPQTTVKNNVHLLQHGETNQTCFFYNAQFALSLNFAYLLNSLQLSIYYYSILKSSSFLFSKLNLSKSTQSVSLGKNQNIATLTPLLTKITKKLPIDLFILSSIEKKLHKQAVFLAIKKAWLQISKTAYTKSVFQTILISKKSVQTELQQESLRKRLSSDSDSEFDPLLDFQYRTRFFLPTLAKPKKIVPRLEKPTKKREIDRFGELFQKTYQYEKKQFSKKGTPNLILVLNIIKKVYQKHVLFALQNFKQPLFSTKYATQLKLTSSLIIDQLSNDISDYLMFKTEFIINKLTLSFIRPLLLGQYLEQIQSCYSSYHFMMDSSKQIIFLKTDYTNNKEAINLKPFFHIYKKYKDCHQFLTLKNLLKMNQKRTNEQNKKSFLSKLKEYKYSFTPKINLNSQQKYRLFNNIYTLSHRERWDADKDWQVFLLYNSAIPEYADFPIFAYKKRLFSTSISSWKDNENSSLTNAASSKNFQDLTELKEEFNLSNAFYSGPGIVKHLLDELNFAEIQKLDKQNRLLLYQLNKKIVRLKKQVQIFIYDKKTQIELKEFCKKRDLLIRRTKLVRKLFRKDSNPSSMILTVLPVLPPDLRPIVKMGGQVAASDLNRLYQRVIYRNERLKKFLKDPATSHSYEMKYAQRLLQEAVDNLIQNGKSGINSEKDSRGRALKSLSDNLKGKQGRFRQFLLGKRVDYSGRTVIVVGPKLKLQECGIPVEMAKELYLPFLLKMILNKNYAKTVVGAKTLLKTNPSLVQELLREIMQISPVLLNRAPTLHRLGIQAFIPKLIEGRAILLHPLVCSAFNADFDGDQMAVHVPITIEARAEAWKLMLSRNNILSPATGDPLAIPSQDMVLGCYYLTTYSNLASLRLLQGSGLFFQDFQDVMKAYQHHKIQIHALVWVKWNGHIENGMDQEEPIEIRISNDGNWQEISVHYYRIYDSHNLLVNQYIATTPGRIVLNLLIHQII